MCENRECLTSSCYILINIASIDTRFFANTQQYQCALVSKFSIQGSPTMGEDKATGREAKGEQLRTWEDKTLSKEEQKGILAGEEGHNFLLLFFYDSNPLRTMP